MHAQRPRVQMCILHTYRHNSQHTLCFEFSTGRQSTALTGLCQGHALSGGASDAGRLAPIPAVSPEPQAAVLLPLLSLATMPCFCHLLAYACCGCTTLRQCYFSASAVSTVLLSSAANVALECQPSPAQVEIHCLTHNHNDLQQPPYLLHVLMSNQA